MVQMKELFSERLEFLQNNFILMANMPWLEQRAIAMKEKIRSNILKSCATGKSSACGFLWRWRKRQDTRNLPG